MQRRWPTEGTVNRDHVCLIAGGFILRVVRLGDPYPGSTARRSLGDVDLLRFKVRSTDRNYWRSVRSFLRWLGADMGDWSERAYKELRRAHHETKEKEWDDVLPPEIVEWANRELDGMMSGCSCVDNVRVARVGNTSQMRRYRRQVAGGCCGFEDFERIGPDGEKYRLGFNHGH